jgi:hypothetical protein
VLLSTSASALQVPPETIMMHSVYVDLVYWFSHTVGGRAGEDRYVNICVIFKPGFDPDDRLSFISTLACLPVDHLIGVYGRRILAR